VDEERKKSVFDELDWERRRRKHQRAHQRLTGRATTTEESKKSVETKRFSLSLATQTKRKEREAGHALQRRVGLKGKYC
jgi:hypothetical protein